jgi:hypothetical protein
MLDGRRARHEIARAPGGGIDRRQRINLDPSVIVFTRRQKDGSTRVTGKRRLSANGADKGFGQLRVIWLRDEKKGIDVVAYDHGCRLAIVHRLL